jgi:2-polyprenyl-3-methyl-5-hydroxy-6-metoxy-1,4-benzoquinol methylase
MKPRCSQLGPFDPDTYDRYEAALRAHLETYYGSTLGLSSRAVAASTEKRLARERGKATASLLDRLQPVKGRKILDVGSGWGELLFELICHGADAHGIEPDADEIEISDLLLASHGLVPRAIRGAGEFLPWEDGTFDMVTCQQVLEHVVDIHQTVAEMVRVTKPGGSLFVSVPNYLFPYEGHYNVKWFPLTPKPIGAAILRSMGRNPGFLLSHVNYTTYPTMSRLWRRHRLDVRNITEELVRSGSHPNPIYKRSIVYFLCTHFKLYPNITWLLRKR